jgi:hypothetical protein
MNCSFATCVRIRSRQFHFPLACEMQISVFTKKKKEKKKKNVFTQMYRDVSDDIKNYA